MHKFKQSKLQKYDGRKKRTQHANDAHGNNRDPTNLATCLPFASKFDIQLTCRNTKVILEKQK